MLLQRDKWYFGYHQIIADCQGNANADGYGGTVLILCNPDADALCAARILAYALRADKVPYQLRPCGGYKRLLEILKKLNLNEAVDADGGNGGGNGGNGNKDYYDEFAMDDAGSTATIRAVILLNFGATRNLQKALFQPTFENTEDGNDQQQRIRHPSLLNKNQTKLYVLDSHRPYHLSNVHADRNIVLLNDYDHWHDEDGGVPSDGDGLSQQSDSDSESDSDDSDSDDSDDDGDGDGLEDSEGEAEFDDDADGGNGSETKVKGNQRKEQDDQNADYDGDDDNDNDDDDEGSQADEHDEDDKKENVGEKRSFSADTSMASPISSSTGSKRPRNEADPATPNMEDSDNNNINSNNKNNALNKDQKQKEEQPPIVSMSNRQIHQDRRNRIRKYYTSGTFHSSPVAFMAYTLLADQLRHHTIGDLLWLACIGVTDALLHNRLDLNGYIKLAMELQTKVDKVYPDLSGEDRLQERMANTMYAEDLYLNNSNNNGPMTQVTFSDNGRVMSQRDEFRFFLLRHTSLWDAMVLSPDLNTKMELWTSSGIRRLKEMLAKMGLPLDQCQQPFAFMKPNLKRRLKLVMMEHEEEFGLENLKYTAFVRVSGYKSLISASDMSLAVTALLECDTHNSDKPNNAIVASSHALSHEEEEEQALLSSFNVAYDALNSNGSSATEGTDLSTLVNGGNITSNTGLGAGVRLAISVQRTIIATAINLVERKAIDRLSHFRYAYLHATSRGVNGSKQFQGSTNTHGNSKYNSNKGGGGDRGKHSQHHIFAKPLALTKLAHYLMDMHRCNNKWTGTKALPLVLLAEKPASQTYLVVGFEYPELKGSIQNNRFGRKFDMAAKTMTGRIHYKFDSFDSNVVEVGAEDVGRFIEQLHYMIDSI
mmetsp:Transcript_17462/g.26410  ORF Transcript_17462/g.26410 Transcript_17462/m.26410 type:complete len:880 (-) Transcript_17462:67-2706(-)